MPVPLKLPEATIQQINVKTQTTFYVKVVFTVSKQCHAGTKTTLPTSSNSNVHNESSSNFTLLLDTLLLSISMSSLFYSSSRITLSRKVPFSRLYGVNQNNFFSLVISHFPLFSQEVFFFQSDLARVMQYSNAMCSFGHF